MKHLVKVCLFLPLLALSSLGAFADEKNALETDWLQMKPGSEEKSILAKVIRVNQTETVDSVEILLPEGKTIPFEEVLVIGKRIDAPVTQVRKVEWFKHPKTQAQGIRIHLMHQPDLEFRLKFYDGDDFKVRP